MLTFSKKHFVYLKYYIIIYLLYVRLQFNCHETRIRGKQLLLRETIHLLPFLQPLNRYFIILKKTLFVSNSQFLVCNKLNLSDFTLSNLLQRLGLHVCSGIRKRGKTNAAGKLFRYPFTMAREHGHSFTVSQNSMFIRSNLKQKIFIKV